MHNHWYFFILKILAKICAILGEGLGNFLNYTDLRNSLDNPGSPYIDFATSLTRYYDFFKFKIGQIWHNVQHFDKWSNFRQICQIWQVFSNLSNFVKFDKLCQIWQKCLWALIKTGQIWEFLSNLTESVVFWTIFQNLTSLLKFGMPKPDLGKPTRNFAPARSHFLTKDVLSNVLSVYICIIIDIFLY